MSSQENGGPNAVKVGSYLPHLASAGDIDARSRLIEEKDRRLVYDSGSNRELALQLG